MAGMFYSIHQVSEKLGKTEEQIKELVKEGRLREFRDGPNLLFKIDEVETLLADTTFMGAKAAAAAEEPVESLEVTKEPAEAAEAGGEEPVEIAGQQEEEISLAPEEAVEAETVESELAESDTALAGEGVSVLDEAEADYKLADDTMAETRSGSAAEMLEEIEEDVNLDTFGSGSGLLDLSLQADDTSLGGILDEIYTAEGQEGEQPEEVGAAPAVAAEAEQMLAEEQVPAEAAPAEVVVSMYAEPEVDAANKIFVIMLALASLIVIYTLIVALAAQSGAIPSLLGSIQGFIWQGTGAVLLVAVILSVAALVISGGSKTAKGPKVKKEKKPKEKKPKEPKPKKEKKKKEKKKGKEPEGQPEEQLP
jgi:hypothetical protein